MKKVYTICLVWLLLGGSAYAQLIVNMENEPANLEANKTCFDCHGNDIYTYKNPVSGAIERKLMNPSFVFNKDDFYTGIHRHFRCTDCHASEYETFPHAAELRFEPKYTCLDCHGNDPTYAKYNFEGIDAAFQKSIHSTKHNENFNCWMCHNPHSYRPVTRGDFKVSQIVSYHNNICASCHDNPQKYQLISDSVKMPLEQIHAFLPNYKLHFSAVRCIECHTSSEDTMWVAHNILDKSLAMKKCAECHSSNTMLMASLYKYQVKQQRRDRGTLNAILLNEAYVVGANRNVYINIISIVLFGLTLIGIAIHTFFRIKKR